MPERLQDRQVDALRATDLRIFKSTEQTGTGSSQNIAHTLGYAPSVVIVTTTELAAGLASGHDIAEGAHTATNIVLTVTSGAKFVVVAF